VAQKWRVKRASDRSGADRRPPPPLDAPALERLALHYVGRYATTRARLRQYLARKVRERGWAGPPAPDIEALAEKLADLRYVDDAAFALARASGLQRRGFGERRIAQALRVAGIEEADAEIATSDISPGSWDAAITFARRKRIGPFAAVAGDRHAREKAIAAMVRAGHSFAVARRIAESQPGDVPEQDS
jgi:regulatory protein